MNNKKISFIIINENTKKNINFSLSHFSFKLIALFILFLTMASITTIIRYYNQPNLKKQFSNIYLKDQKLNTMIKFLHDEDIINDSLLNSFALYEEYDNLKNIIPISQPVDGIVTRGIIDDPKNPHYGIDIAATFKSDIKAIKQGLVIFSGKINHLGNTIIIAHPNNYYSLYAHMHNRLVSKREFVNQNQIIGEVGKSNHDDGPHLHFEIWHNNLIIDPRNLIEEYKVKDVSIK